MEERGSPGAAAEETATKKMGWGGRAELGQLRDEWEASLLEKELFKGLIWVPDQLHKPSLTVFSFLTACSPSPRPAHTLPFLALSTLGLATYPIPTVLFSAGEGKRCWHLSRRAYV